MRRSALKTAKESVLKALAQTPSQDLVRGLFEILDREELAKCLPSAREMVEVRKTLKSIDDRLRRLEEKESRSARAESQRPLGLGNRLG